MPRARVAPLVAARPALCAGQQVQKGVSAAAAAVGGLLEVLRQRACEAARFDRLMSEEGNVPVPAGATLKEESAAPPMPLGAYVKEEEVPFMPLGAFFKEEEVVPPTPPGGVVKQEHGVVVVRGDGLLGGRPKRQRKN